MNETANSADPFRAVLVVLATLGTIAFNILAVAGLVNGVTPAMISAKYPTVLTPAAYAFTIWSLIYLGLMAFSVFQLLPSNVARFRNIRTLYILSCLLNCGWIYFWHREALGICLALISCLLVTLVLIMWQFRVAASSREALFTKAPFGIYAGWVTVATMINLAVVLNSANLNMTARGWNIFAVTCLVLASAAAVFVRFKLRHFLYPLAIAWGATAIALDQSGNTVIIVASAACVVVCLVLSVSFVMDLKGSTR